MYHELVFQYVKASVLFFWAPFVGVQGFCLGQLGEGSLEEDCGDQGLLLLLGAGVFWSQRLEIVGRLGWAGFPKSRHVSWVCFSFKLFQVWTWWFWKLLASSRCFFRNAWSSSSCFCLNSQDSFSWCFFRCFSSFSWMVCTSSIKFLILSTTWWR